MNYRLATSPADYKKCHALMSETEKCELSFPTFMAEEETKELAGFISTRPRVKTDGIIVAGPLVVKGRRPIVSFRLGEVYDLFMKSLGLTFFFEVEDLDYAEQLKRLGYLVHREEEGIVWFKSREIIDGQ